jgi:azurin
VQLGNDLAAELPESQGTEIRHSLRELGVRVVALRTLREQMQYDLRYFAVQAGKPVEILVENDDAMPHNLVIVQPGALQEVAVAGGVLPPPSDPNAIAYVPASPKVLQSTPLVQPGDTATLNFAAPQMPGAYPFMCTFPGHWVRMYGVMLVVPDLEEWEKNPTPPSDPLTYQKMTAQKNAPTGPQDHQH